MKELSNSTLVILVLMAIIASIGGTIISLNKLNQLAGVTSVTGFASSITGKANLTVATTLDITLVDSVVELGTIPVNFTNNSDNRHDWFWLRNQGSTNITIRAGSNTATDQKGQYASGLAGRGPFEQLNHSVNYDCLTKTNFSQRCFMIKCKNSTSTTAICNTTYVALPIASQLASSRKLIQHLPTPTLNNSVWFGVQASVPPNELAGVKTIYIDFNSVQG
jgi:hypothetical protein